MRRLARFRRLGSLGLLMVVPLVGVALDFWRRGGRIRAFEQVYALTYVASFV